MSSTSSTANLFPAEQKNKKDFMNFNNFNFDPRLKQGITKAGYETPTPIQEAAIPAALRGRDIIGTAQTGTGKTAAFVLPILNKLLNGTRNTPRALIVTPTRELADQINDVVKTLSAGTKLKSATIYGGVGAGPQIQALRNGAEILVACPGRLLDLIAQGHAKMANIEILVLDEATSALDSEVEAAIQENLFALMRGKTVIAIAHRLSTISQLDRLVVLDRGAIVEMGAHKDLVEAGGLYADLWSRQSGGFIAPTFAEQTAAE